MMRTWSGTRRNIVGKLGARRRRRWPRNRRLQAKGSRSASGGHASRGLDAKRQQLRDLRASGPADRRRRRSNRRAARSKCARSSSGARRLARQACPRCDRSAGRSIPAARRRCSGRGLPIRCCQPLGRGPERGPATVPAMIARVIAGMRPAALHGLRTRPPIRDT